MTHGTLRALALAALAMALQSQGAAADDPPDRAAAIAGATQEAEHWLQAMDSRRYADGWAESATVVREGRTEQDWVQEFGAPREALGKPVIRELKKAEYSTRVRGAPEGEYVTAVYLTKFTNVPPAVVETVLLAKENGSWRIGGYNLAPAPDAPPPPPSAQPGSAPETKPKD